MSHNIGLFRRAEEHRSRVALRSHDVQHHYGDLLERSAQVASGLLNEASDLKECRVAYMVPTGADYIATQWGIWRAGGVAVPLCLSAATPEIEYALEDSQAQILMGPKNLTDKLEPLARKSGARLVLVGDALANPASRPLPELDLNRRAMMLYTSGTTNKPKGVVTTHAMIESQITALVDAWKWAADDCIPLFLPLHHIHGIINIMSCALWSGAMIEPFHRFQIEELAKRVVDGAYTLFMAVPTIYVKWIEYLESIDEDQRKAIVSGFSKMRLMVCGSAALPASLHHKWTQMTGQALLERYGMTEIGMGLSNPYVGERRPGSVGLPLPRVEVRLKAENGEIITRENEPGEIQVRGPSVFLEYWNRPEATAESFDGGWFRTGDMAVVESGYYRILGRMSVDIIKSGGYKISALEIEAALLEHPAIAECAVVGVPDMTWGEAVAAAIVLQGKMQLELDELRAWAKQKLSHYKVPSRMLVVDELPRNAMGKVTKPKVIQLFCEASI